MSDTRNLNADALGDLYEALTEALITLESDAEDAIGSSIPEWEEAADRRLSIARAALRKARGEG